MIDKRLILGSSSKFRARILTDFGYEFTVLKPSINEKIIGGSREDPNADPSSIALAVAHAKADALLVKLQGTTNTILITLDQVVSHNGHVREKPVDANVCFI